MRQINARAAKSEDFEFLKDCWTECFDDDERYVDWNFSNNYTYSNALVAEYDDSPAAAMYLIPHTIEIGKYEISARYISGVGTMPRFRNLGLVRRLFEHGLPLMQKDGCALAFLISAVDGMYEKFGFSKVGERAVYSADGIKEGRIYNKSEIDIAQISRIYRCQTENTLHIKRERSDWCKLVDELTDAIGGFATVNDNSYCFGFDSENGGEIYEQCGRASHKPIRFEPFMARITDTEQFLNTFSNIFDKDTVIDVSDEFISRNNGRYLILTNGAVRLDSESHKISDYSFKIDELCRFVLSKIPIFIGNII